MLDVSRCPECSVPIPFSQGQVWMNNGDIVQSGNPGARVGFIECENLDPLFANIGEIVGEPIEEMIINITARGTKRYVKLMASDDILEMIDAGQIPPEFLIDPIITYCHVVGYGRYEYIESRYERDELDYSRYGICDPFSVPEAAGALAGATAAVVGGEHAVSYYEISPGYYEYSTCWAEYPVELKTKLPIPSYRHRDGDIDLPACPSCGCPAAFRNYRWYLDRGIIVNRNNGRRMALLGPELLDNLFEALESELGPSVPEVVVEAQRRFTKTGFYTIEEVSDEGDFRTQLALRGMGNLREMSMGSGGLSLRVDNAACYLLIVGMVQGLFEMAIDVGSYAEWELSPEHNLSVAVRPRAQKWAVSL